MAAGEDDESIEALLLEALAAPPPPPEAAANECLLHQSEEYEYDPKKQLYNGDISSLVEQPPSGDRMPAPLGRGGRGGQGGEYKAGDSTVTTTGGVSRLSATIEGVGVGHRALNSRRRGTSASRGRGKTEGFAMTNLVCQHEALRTYACDLCLQLNAANEKNDDLMAHLLLLTAAYNSTGGGAVEKEAGKRARQTNESRGDLDGVERGRTNSSTRGSTSTSDCERECRGSRGKERDEMCRKEDNGDDEEEQHGEGIEGQEERQQQEEEVREEGRQVSLMTLAQLRGTMLQASSAEARHARECVTLVQQQLDDRTYALQRLRVQAKEHRAKSESDGHRYRVRLVSLQKDLDLAQLTEQRLAQLLRESEDSEACLHAALGEAEKDKAQGEAERESLRAELERTQELLEEERQRTLCLQQDLESSRERNLRAEGRVAVLSSGDMAEVEARLAMEAQRTRQEMERERGLLWTEVAELKAKLAAATAQAAAANRAAAAAEERAAAAAGGGGGGSGVGEAAAEAAAPTTRGAFGNG